MTKEIRLTQGYHALVDDEDYDIVNQHNWRVNEHRKHPIKYAIASIDKQQVSLHRFLMNPPEDREVDHVNGDGLDNRRSNLRIVTHRENQQNLHRKSSSKYPGVSWVAKRKQWRSGIHYKGKEIFLGSFNKSEEKEAAKLYDKAANAINNSNFEEFLTKLRATPKQKTSSVYPGVVWNKPTQKWRATISLKKVPFHLGLFDSEEDAGIAYLKAKKAIKEGRFPEHYNSIKAKKAKTFDQTWEKHMGRGVLNV